MAGYVWRKSAQRLDLEAWAEYERMNARANREYEHTLSHGISDRSLMTDRTLAAVRQHDRDRYAAKVAA